METTSYDSHGNRRLKILLTEGSSITVREVLFALGPCHTIDILDPSPTCQGRFSRFVRKWYRCPPYTTRPEDYLAAVAARIEAERYDVLFPTHEQVYLLSRVRDELRSKVGVALPAFDALQRVQSKVRFVKLLQELALPLPITRLVATREQLLAETVFPCFVKLAYSTAGTGVHRVHNADQLRRVADELQEIGLLNGHEDVLVQQPARGKQAVC